MKTILCIITNLALSLFIGLIPSIGISQNKKGCLIINGIIRLEENIPATKARLTIYEEDKEINTILPNNKGFFSVKIELNRNYSITIEQEGYLKRLICIDSKIHEAYSNKRHKHEIDLSLERIKEKENFYHDFPIAIIYFDMLEESFRHSKEYTRHIKSLMTSNVH